MLADKRIGEVRMVFLDPRVENRGGHPVAGVACLLGLGRVDERVLLHVHGAAADVEVDPAHLPVGGEALQPGGVHPAGDP